jgi:5,10-methylenetetrahydrofolate reductase
MVLQEHAYQYSPVVLGITIPVIPGIMPIQAYASFLRVTKLCGTHIPDRIHADLESIKVLPSKFSLHFPPI